MLARRIGRNDGLGTAFRQPIAQTVGVVGSIRDQPSGRRNRWQQIPCGGKIVAITGGDQERERTAAVFSQRVDFGGAPAARATDRLLEVPPFAPAAERWALTCVESIDIVPTRPVEPVSA